MSLLSNIFDNLSDNNEKESVIRPCQNCESDCGVYPKACEECEPYKEKLIDALYNVANIDAFYDRYEVISPDFVPAGATECPVCGAPVIGYYCEYCGSCRTRRGLRDRQQYPPTKAAKFFHTDESSDNAPFWSSSSERKSSAGKRS